MSKNAVTSGAISSKSVLSELAKSSVSHVIVVGTHRGNPFVAQARASSKREHFDASIAQLREAIQYLTQQRMLLSK